MQQPEVTGFFDDATNTISYVVVDPDTRKCAIVDSVLDYNSASGRTSGDSADRLIAYLDEHDLELEWIIDTHVHADHLTAADYIRDRRGGRAAIGRRITEVQEIFGALFNEGQEFHTDGSQFDHLFDDGDEYSVGNIPAKAIATPGHTPACMSHLIGDALFVGDTLFMPDFGTARCDFPGGSAEQLYDSVQRLYEFPEDTRMFMCHDYKAKGRDFYAWETTVGEQKQKNIQLASDTDKTAFVDKRSARDATLGMPKLIVPSVQINIRAGEFPEPEDNGKRYIKVPLNEL